MRPATHVTVIRDKASPSLLPEVRRCIVLLAFLRGVVAISSDQLVDHHITGGTHRPMVVRGVRLLLISTPSRSRGTPWAVKTKRLRFGSRRALKKPEGAT